LSARTLPVTLVHHWRGGQTGAMKPGFHGLPVAGGGGLPLPVEVESSGL